MGEHESVAGVGTWRASNGDNDITGGDNIYFPPPNSLWVFTQLSLSLQARRWSGNEIQLLVKNGGRSYIPLGLCL